MISIIVAASSNDVIGVQGTLPWRLSSDLKRFKEITLGKPIVMGRLTWESIGRPLPGRQNILITRQADFDAEGADVVTTPAEALRVAGDADEVMIIGGGQVYDLFLPKASRVYLTRVHTEIEGDTWFPPIDDSIWQLSGSERHPADENNDYAFEFQVFERR
ncbi:MAG: type 3 dihydrofolate reductase [Pseudomonadota bacterium]